MRNAKCIHGLGFYLAEDEHFVATSLEMLQHAFQQLHFAALAAHLLSSGKSGAAVIAPADEVWVVTILAHLHEDIVELGNTHVAASLRLGHGCHCLLHMHTCLVMIL